MKISSNSSLAIEANREKLAVETGVARDSFRCLSCWGALHSIRNCPFQKKEG